MITMKHKLILASAGAFLMLGSTIALAAGDASAGKTKYAQCSFCHGQDAKGTETAPPLAGLEKTVFANHIGAFKSGARKNPMMEMMAKKVSDQDVEDIVAYLGTL